MTAVDIFRILVFTTAAAYLFYTHFQKREVADERAKLIHLKSLEAVQKGYSAVIVSIAGLYFFFAPIDAIYVLATFAVALFVTYPLSSMYYKRSL